MELVFPRRSPASPPTAAPIAVAVSMKAAFARSHCMASVAALIANDSNGPGATVFGSASLDCMPQGGRWLGPSHLTLKARQAPKRLWVIGNRVEQEQIHTTRFPDLYRSGHGADRYLFVSVHAGEGFRAPTIYLRATL